MTKSRSAATSLCLICALIAAPLAPSVRAGKAARARATGWPVYVELSAPIGTVEAFGKVLVDGRAIAGKTTIRSGELIQAPAGSNARVQLDAAGQITLPGGASARLALAASAPPSPLAHNVLLVSLESGEIKTELLPETMAYVEIGDQALLASAGASFRVSVYEDEARVEVGTGTLWWGQGREQDDYTARTGELDRTATTPTSLSGAFVANRNDHEVNKPVASASKIAFEVKRKTGTSPRTNKSRKLIAHFSSSSFSPVLLKLGLASSGSWVSAPARPLQDSSGAKQAAQGERPAAGETLIIRLKQARLGCLEDSSGVCVQQVEVQTNDQGVAEVSFRAASKRTSGDLTLCVKNTNFCDKFKVNVGKPPIFTKPLKLTLMVAAVAVIIGVTVIKLHNKQPIRPVPPPVIP